MLLMCRIISKHVVCIISFNTHKHSLGCVWLALLFCHFTERKTDVKWPHCHGRIEATLRKLDQHLASGTTTHPLSLSYTYFREINFPLPRVNQSMHALHSISFLSYRTFLLIPSTLPSFGTFSFSGILVYFPLYQTMEKA